MVRVNAAVKKHSLIHLSASGHAGAGYKGNDIVCASVSLLLEAVCLGIESIPGIGISGGAYTEGELELRLLKIPADFAKELEGITRVLLLGLKRLEDEYPGEIRLRIEELQ